MKSPMNPRGGRRPSDPGNAFIDLVGASGATYRFRRVAALDQLPASGGNFVCTRGEGAALELVCAGVVSSLSLCRETCAQALSAYGATDFYVRLNIVGSTRELEHQDI